MLSLVTKFLYYTAVVVAVTLKKTAYLVCSKTNDALLVYDTKRQGGKPTETYVQNAGARVRLCVCIPTPSSM